MPRLSRIRLRLETFEPRIVPADLYNDGNLVIVAATRPGIIEPKVPVYVGGIYKEDANAIEGYQRVPGTSNYPQRWVVLNNTYSRQTYPTPNKQTASFGTSVINTVSFRTDAGFNLIPEISRMDVDVTNGETVVKLTGTFGTVASEIITLRFPLYKTEAAAKGSIQFVTHSDIPLSNVGMDALRTPSVSTMLTGNGEYDASDVTFREKHNIPQRLRLSESAPNAHLFAAPQAFNPAFREFTAHKQPGSTWFPDSPSVTLKYLDGSVTLPGNPAAPLDARLQGYRLGSANPNDDSVSLWGEIVGTPNILPAGTSITLNYHTAARPPKKLSDTPSAPVVLGPTGTISDSSPSLTWAPIVGAVKYDVWLTKSNATMVRTDSVNPTFTVPNDLLQGTYAIRVRAFDAQNRPSLWSKTATFKVAVPAPVLTAPTGLITDRTPTIVFTSVAEAVAYEVAVNRGSRRVLTSPVADTSLTLTTPLSQGAHSVMVRSRNVRGELSLWSAAIKFNVDVPTPVAPVPIGPSGPVNDLTPTFGWGAVPFASAYDFKIDDLTTNTMRIIQRRVTDPTWTRDFPLAPHNFRWSVRAVNEFNEAGPWVVGGEFQVRGNVLEDLKTTRHWITYAPRNYNPDINKLPTVAQIRADLKLLYSEGWRGLITWSMEGTLGQIPKIAKEVGFSYVIAGLYLYDAASTNREMTAALAEQTFVDAFIAGNEGLQIGQRYNLATLTQVIADLHTATGKPVGTCETGGYYLSNPSLLELGDFVMTNIHPWHSQIRVIADAVQHTVNEYTAVRNLAPAGKLVYMRESWWPTAGDPAATPAKQVEYFTLLSATSALFAFGEAFEQLFKNEPPWAFHTATGVKKLAVTKLAAIYRDPV